MSDPISVSEERLKLILAEFKLEMFERLSRDFAAKANVADVEALKARVSETERLLSEAKNVRDRVLPQFEGVQKDLDELKAAAADAKAVSRYKRIVIGAIVTGIGLASGAAGYGISLLFG